MDTTLWELIYDPPITDQVSIYGNKNEGSDTTRPSARAWSLMWMTSSLDLFIFGGFGHGEELSQGSGI